MHINFFQKQEFKLEKGKTGRLQLLDQHPLLMDYNEQAVSMYINSKPENSANLKSDLETGVTELLKGWRKWECYFLDIPSRLSISIFENNLLSGSGKIFEGPISIANEITNIFKKYNVLTKSFPGLLKKNQFKLLLIDDNFVVANAFKIV